MSILLPDPNAGILRPPPRPLLDPELALLLEQIRDTLASVDALLALTCADSRLAPDQPTPPPHTPITRPQPESDTAQVNDPPEPRH